MYGEFFYGLHGQSVIIPAELKENRGFREYFG